MIFSAFRLPSVRACQDRRHVRGARAKASTASGIVHNRDEDDYLIEYQRAVLVDSVDDIPPRANMIIIPDARGIGPFGTLLNDEGTLRHDQGTAALGALDVVSQLRPVGTLASTERLRVIDAIMFLLRMQRSPTLSGIEIREVAQDVAVDISTRSREADVLEGRRRGTS